MTDPGIEIITIVHFECSWALYDLKAQEIVQRGYADHDEAVIAAETRAYRLAQGWLP